MLVQLTVTVMNIIGTSLLVCAPIVCYLNGLQFIGTQKPELMCPLNKLFKVTVINHWSRSSLMHVAELPHPALADQHNSAKSILSWSCEIWAEPSMSWVVSLSTFLTWSRCLCLLDWPCLMKLLKDWLAVLCNAYPKTVGVIPFNFL